MATKLWTLLAAALAAAAAATLDGASAVLSIDANGTLTRALHDNARWDGRRDDIARGVIEIRAAAVDPAAPAYAAAVRLAAGGVGVLYEEIGPHGGDPHATFCAFSGNSSRLMTVACVAPDGSRSLVIDGVGQVWTIAHASCSLERLGTSVVPKGAQLPIRPVCAVNGDDLAVLDSAHGTLWISQVDSDSAAAIMLPVACEAPAVSRAVVEGESSHRFDVVCGGLGPVLGVWRHANGSAPWQTIDMHAPAASQPYPPRALLYLAPDGEHYAPLPRVLVPVADMYVEVWHLSPPTNLSRLHAWVPSSPAEVWLTIPYTATPPNPGDGDDTSTLSSKDIVLIVLGSITILLFVSGLFSLILLASYKKCRKR